jgi:lipoyl-dependent peroxiredoxin subunit C
MKGVKSRFPQYSLKAVRSIEEDNAFIEVNEDHFSGKWKLYFFWPKDFTFVCPTEIAGFAKLSPEFEKKNCVILGGSTDSEFVHLAWRQSRPDIRDIPFLMLSDIKRELSTELGILDPNEGVCQRATFIVDPENIIRYIEVNDLSVGRNPEEALRILEALQSGGLCGCNWQPGDQHL